MGAYRNFDHVFNFVFSSLKTLFVAKFPKKNLLELTMGTFRKNYMKL